MPDQFKPYADRFTAPSGPGDSRPTALQIVEDNDLIDKWAGKVALVTGGTSGIGVETVRALHATGADVFFTARDTEKGAAVRQDIAARSNGTGRLEVIELNLDSLQSVKKAAKAFLSQSSKLNMLVNNAGIMATPYSRTEDGFERQFAVNHLAHYLLTTLLLPTLESSSSPQQNSRLVFVSSSGHQFSSIIWDDYNFKTRGAYDPFKAYGQSKTANIWTANYIDRTFGPRGVHALSLHPGVIWTGLQSHTDPNMVEQWKSDPKFMNAALTTEQGAATSVWAAVGKIWEGKGGKYLFDCGVGGPTKSPPGVDSGFATFAYNPEGEDRLWELSAKLVDA